MDYRGINLFRYRIVSSLISGRQLTLTQIRNKSDYPGLTQSEVSYLQLISQLTTGSVIEINESGTELLFVPGVITNNPTTMPLSFDCDPSRSLGFYLEGILPFVVFGKNKLNINLRGPSHSPKDTGIDLIIHTHLPILKKFGLEDVSLKVTSRGSLSEANLTLTPVKKLHPISLTDPGKIKKVRGVAFTSKMNVQMGNRAAYAAKGLLHSFLPDIWIHTDHSKAGEAALGITLVAESNTDCFIGCDFLKDDKSYLEQLETDVPEDLANLAVLGLMDEVMYGGCVDSNNQALALILMALAGGESALRLGRISVGCIGVMRLLYDVFNLRFNFEEEENPAYGMQDDEAEEDVTGDLPRTTLVKCIGIGYENMARIGF